ncbi:hypothetical protein GR7B_00116 [Vibrio phage vB_VcorM_GR7B]|nr:hypothetical protein GR7B_00116 [Vibrio phage vB_VcorM_GR7B]
MLVKVMNKHGDIAEEPFGHVVDQQWYTNKLGTDSLGGMKIPSYSGLYYLTAEEIEGSKYYRCTEPVFLRDSHNNVMPIQIVRDEIEHDKTKFITIIMGESSSADDYVNFWTKGFNLEEFGMSTHDHGLMTLRMNVEEKNLKRFYRPFKKLVETPQLPIINKAYNAVDVTTLRNAGVEVSHPHHTDEIAADCERYKEDFLKYWESTGKHHTVSEDQLLFLNFFTGFNFDRWITAEIDLGDCSGLAVFSVTDNGEELYWDFSRRTVGNNIGNVLLYHGYLLAKALGCKYYNFGVGYYDWKRMWCEEEKYHKGIQFNNDIPQQLLDLIPEACDHGYNKDRTSL